MIDPDATIAVPALIEVLKGEGQDGRMAAVIALGRIGSPSRAAVPDLIVAANDPPLREVAILALAGIGPQAKEAIPLLRVAMADKGERWSLTWMHAAYALGSIDPALAKEAVPELIAVIRKCESSDRGDVGARDAFHAAAQALRVIDPGMAAKEGLN